LVYNRKKEECTPGVTITLNITSKTKHIVANPIINLPFGDGVCHPLLVIFGMVGYWLYMNFRHGDFVIGFYQS
jgi:hypothetical protein